MNCSLYCTGVSDVSSCSLSSRHERMWKKTNLKNPTLKVRQLLGIFFYIRDTLFHRCCFLKRPDKTTETHQVCNAAHETPSPLHSHLSLFALPHKFILLSFHPIPSHRAKRHILLNRNSHNTRFHSLSTRWVRSSTIDVAVAFVAGLQ